MAISDRLNKLTTDITNAYTSIENKGGTIPANKNTNNLSIAIDSIEVIEQATAEGESLSLTNTKAMPYSDYVVEGKSEQATRSGKNLFNYSDYTYDKTIQNAYRFIEIKNAKPSTNYVISNYDSLVNSGFSDVYLAFGTSYSEINYANLVGADYVRFYTKTDGKMYLCAYSSSWTEELWNTFISYFENAQVEQGTTPTSYEPYGASPSPDYPSEIHSVADDVNLFDKNASVKNTGYVTSYTYSNGVYTIIPTGTGNPQIRLNVSIPQGTYTLNSDSYLSIATILRNNNGLLYSFENNYENQTFTINEDSTELVFNWVNPNNTAPIILDLRTLKLQKGTEVTPYSPYNQGTVTIKQRGKNLAYTGWAEDFVTRINNTNNAKIENYDNRNCLNVAVNAGYGDYDNKYLFKINWKENTQYTFKLDLLNTNTENRNRFMIHYKDNTSEQVCFTTTGNVWNSVSFTSASNKTIKYITPNYISGRLYIDLDTFMVYEGTQETSYEPHQTPHDYTIQTEPLRSLPNGVKDSKDTKQHTRVGVKVFDGSENNWNIETTANYTRFYIKIDDAVINTTERQMIMSNYFKYGTGNLVGTAFIYNQYLFIYPNTDILTIEKLKTWLSTHNTEVLYPLEEEVIEPLTQNQATTMLDIIKTGSYEGTTNIYTDKNVKPTMKAGYYKKG